MTNWILALDSISKLIIAIVAYLSFRFWLKQKKEDLKLKLGLLMKDKND